ncbi:MAG: hypothetical protein LBK13_01590 [Spirochaetales bacterium]|nr:hypothetical protein [Spirochaetales bacterium]
MGRKLLIFGLSAALLALGMYAASEYFEISPESVREGPSAKARANAYLALERWLEETGHPVEVLIEKPGESVFSGPKILCVQASGSAWEENVTAGIFSWVRGGGFLFLYGDRPALENAAVKNFLKELGVRIQTLSGGDGFRQRGNKDFPDFDPRLIVKPVKENPNRPRMKCYKDSGGYIRLISVSMGKGAVAVCGDPLFMRSRSLWKKENARLAWELTGARDTAGEGIIFIRGRNEKDSMYGALAAKGRLLFVIISAGILAVTGFWMVIPVFGRIKNDLERPGRPLRERFLAEGRFLKKFGALESYLEMYRKEIQFKSRLGSEADPQVLARRLAPLCGMDEQIIRKALMPRKNVKFREFIKQTKILKTLWEKINR